MTFTLPNGSKVRCRSNRRFALVDVRTGRVIARTSNEAKAAKAIAHPGYWVLDLVEGVVR